MSQLKYGLIDIDAAEESTKPKECPQFMLETSEATGAQKGTATHIFMQFCDFDRCEKGISEITAEADRLESERFITSRQRELLDFGKIAAFFEGTLYNTVIKPCKRLYRERRFNLSLPVSSLIKEADGSSDAFVLVQGVIDCFCLNKDGTYTLIDFKTDRVPKSEYGEKLLVERHSEQMRFYKEAVEKMTGGIVSKSVLWSFELGKEIEL